MGVDGKLLLTILLRKWHPALYICDLCQKKQSVNVVDMRSHAITANTCLQKLKSSDKSNFTLKYLASVLTGKKQKDPVNIISLQSMVS